jgi:hypothetical protein
VFGEKPLADLTIAIGLMNAYNRMAISCRATPMALAGGDGKAPTHHDQHGPRTGSRVHAQAALEAYVPYPEHQRVLQNLSIRFAPTLWPPKSDPNESGT